MNNFSKKGTKLIYTLCSRVILGDSTGFNGIHMFPIFVQVTANWCFGNSHTSASGNCQWWVSVWHFEPPLLRPQGLQVAFRMPCHFDPHTADIRRIRRSYSKQQTRKETRHFIRKLGASLLFRSYPCCCMADTKAASVKHVQKSEAVRIGRVGRWNRTPTPRSFRWLSFIFPISNVAWPDWNVYSIQSHIFPVEI